MSDTRPLRRSDAMNSTMILRILQDAGRDPRALRGPSPTTGAPSLVMSIIGDDLDDDDDDADDMEDEEDLEDLEARRGYQEDSEEEKEWSTAYQQVPGPWDEAMFWSRTGPRALLTDVQGLLDQDPGLVKHASAHLKRLRVPWPVERDLVARLMVLLPQLHAPSIEDKVQLLLGDLSPGRGGYVLTRAGTRVEIKDQDQVMRVARYLRLCDWSLLITSDLLCGPSRVLGAPSTRGPNLVRALLEVDAQRRRMSTPPYACASALLTVRLTCRLDCPLQRRRLQEYPALPARYILERLRPYPWSGSTQAALEAVLDHLQADVRFDNGGDTAHVRLWLDRSILSSAPPTVGSRLLHTLVTLPQDRGCYHVVPRLVANGHQVDPDPLHGPDVPILHFDADPDPNCSSNLRLLHRTMGRREVLNVKRTYRPALVSRSVLLQPYQQCLVSFVLDRSRRPFWHYFGDKVQDQDRTYVVDGRTHLLEVGSANHDVLQRRAVLLSLPEPVDRVTTVVYAHLSANKRSGCALVLTPSDQILTWCSLVQQLTTLRVLDADHLDAADPESRLAIVLRDPDVLRSDWFTSVRDRVRLVIADHAHAGRLSVDELPVHTYRPPWSGGWVILDQANRFLRVPGSRRLWQTRRAIWGQNVTVCLIDAGRTPLGLLKLCGWTPTSGLDGRTLLRALTARKDGVARPARTTHVHYVPSDHDETLLLHAIQRPLTLVGPSPPAAAIDELRRLLAQLVSGSCPLAGRIAAELWSIVRQHQAAGTRPLPCLPTTLDRRLDAKLDLLATYLNDVYLPSRKDGGRLVVMVAPGAGLGPVRSVLTDHGLVPVTVRGPTDDQDGTSDLLVQVPGNVDSPPWRGNVTHLLLLGGDHDPALLRCITGNGPHGPSHRLDVILYPNGLDRVIWDLRDVGGLPRGTALLPMLRTLANEADGKPMYIALDQRMAGVTV